VFFTKKKRKKKEKVMAKGFSKVLIVGAGPAGLLLALLLAQHDIKVDVVEALVGIDERPRGAGYGPAAIQYASGRVKPPVC
jgi:flavin-dependent dehydrogenase